MCLTTSNFTSFEHDTETPKQAKVSIACLETEDESILEEKFGSTKENDPIYFLIPKIHKN